MRSPTVKSATPGPTDNGLDLTNAKFALPGDARALPPAVAAVIAALEADIIQGRILPRSRLIEDHLMEDYGAKRHAVRAALDELQRLGVVTKPRHRGAELRRFDAGEIARLYDLRETLHRMAVRCMRRPDAEIDPAEIETLDHWLRLHVEAARQGDVVAVHRSNMMFHDALFSLSGNPFLAASIRQHDWISFPIRAYGVTDADALAQASREHREMVDALKDGRFNELEGLVVAHISRARDIYERRFFVERSLR